MQYQVIDEDGIENVEFGFFIEFGTIFDAEDIEPDLLNNWLNYDRVAPVGAALPEPESFDEEDAEPEDE